MSYSIMYEHVFLRSNEGITPVVLMGDNNVYEGSGRNERRARDWSVLFNEIGTTEQALLDIVQPYLGGYNEHWKSGGKWVDDDALVRFIKNGCKNAVSMEDLRSLNPYTSARARLSAWAKDLNNHHELDAWVSTTAELDDWIAKARVRITDLRARGYSVYPIIDFGHTEKLAKAKKTFLNNEPVVLKDGKFYLTKIKDHGSEWNVDPAKALVMPYVDAAAITGKVALNYDKPPRIISAKTVQQPRNHVLYFADGYYAGTYVTCVSRSRFGHSGDVQYAHRYSTPASAKAACAKLAPRVTKYGTLVVKEV